MKYIYTKRKPGEHGEESQRDEKRNSEPDIRCTSEMNSLLVERVGLC